MDGDTSSHAHGNALPDAAVRGSTVLVASPVDPAAHAVPLRVLARYERDGDVAFAVSTTKDAEATVDDHRRTAGRDRAALGVVDTTSERQSVASVYGGTPVVYTPAPGDLERLVLALSELYDRLPADGERHLVVRSLDPLVESTPEGRVPTLLDRLTGLPTADGLCLLGLEYTRHDRDTRERLLDAVDAVVWASHPGDGLELDYERTSASRLAGGRGG